jgi:thiol-disulfide isomerase/thioredoxin
MSEESNASGPVPAAGLRRALSRRTVIYGSLVAALAALAGGVAFSLRRFALEPEDAQALEVFLSHAWVDAEGRPFDAQALRGQPMILNFWATWCPPCVEEMPELAQLHRSLGPAGLQVVGVGIDQATRIQAFERRMSLGYPLLVAGAAGAELGRRFGNPSGALPYTVVIDRSGRVRDRILGRFVFSRLESQARAVTGVGASLQG